MAYVVVLCCPKTLCISKFGYIKAVMTDSKCPCYRDIRLRNAVDVRQEPITRSEQLPY